MSDAYKQLLGDNGDVPSPLQEKINRAVKATDELKSKEFEVHKAKVENQFIDLERRRKQQEAAKTIRIDLVSPDYYLRLKRENTEYFQLAQGAPFFINDDFDQVVPYFARNLILIGAKSGNGKSTLSGNLTYHTILQAKKTLVLTNEELDTDVFNRVTCLIKGWSYTNHKKFTQQQVDTFNEYYEKLGPMMTVVSDNFGDDGIGGKTTTLEGVKAIFNSLLSLPTKYEVIIFDYFQNVTQSLEHPGMSQYEILDDLAQFLDNFRKIYNAPIIVLSQLKSNEDDSFKERIERCKSIYNKCTCALEMVADPKNSTTVFGVHKSRFSGAIGKNVTVGYNRGMFVKYDKDFINHVHQAEMDKLNGKETQAFISSVMKKS